MYLKATLFAPLSAGIKLFVWLTGWVWALWPAFTAERYPWFTWLYTHDDDVFGYRWTWEITPLTFWGRYKRALWWMYRNPGYGFNAFVLGMDAAGVSVETSADRRTWFHYRAGKKVGFGIERRIGPFAIQWGWDDYQLVAGNMKFDFSVALR